MITDFVLLTIAYLCWNVWLIVRHVQTRREGEK
jgi:hypothetical protein